jgi:hypothetical protein
MPEDQGVKDGVRRRGFKLNEAFRILGISDGTDHSLVKKGKLRVVRLGKRLPIVSEKKSTGSLKKGSSKPFAGREPTDRPSWRSGVLSPHVALRKEKNQRRATVL